MAKFVMRGYGMIEDENGEHFGEKVDVIEIPDEEVRHCDICTFCGSKLYPNCIETCLVDLVRQNRD